MKLSAKTICALKMFIDLGEHYNEGFISLTEIAARKEISKKFLEQIVPLYKNTSLIITNRGNIGGYKLNKNPESISLKDIIYVCETDLQKNITNSAPIDNILENIDNILESYLSKTTLKELIDMQIYSYSNNYVI